MPPVSAVIAAALIVAALTAVLALDAYGAAVCDAGADFIMWVDHHDALGMVILGMADALAVILLLAAFVLTMGAGYLFGVVRGAFLIVLATTVGATIAFLIGRHLLERRAERWLTRQRRLNVLATLVRDGGWQGIALLRMIPFVPFKSSNYVFGAMSVGLFDFVVGTIIGILPMTLVTAAAGAMAGDIAQAVTAGVHRSPLEWALHGLGLVVAAGMVFVVAGRARRVLQEAADSDDQRAARREDAPGGPASRS